MAFTFLGRLGSPHEEFRALSAPAGGICAALSDVRALFARHGVPAATLDECMGSVTLQDKNALDESEFIEIFTLLKLIAAVASNTAPPKELRPMTHADRDRCCSLPALGLTLRAASYARIFASAGG